MPRLANGVFGLSLLFDDCLAPAYKPPPKIVTEDLTYPVDLALQDGNATTALSKTMSGNYDTLHSVGSPRHGGE